MATKKKFYGKDFQKKMDELKGGHKGVELTKGNRLPHGYEIVKGADKTHDYSKGKKKIVGLKKGYRLPHGYVTTKGAKNKKYETGGGVEDKYVVNVENIGNITCKTMAEAEEIYNDYVKQSESGVGRAAYENVWLIIDGEVEKNHLGSTMDDNEEQYAEGGRLTSNEDLIKSFLTTKDNKKVDNLLTKYNSETDEVFLINYSTIIAKKKKSQVTISTKKYSVTTTKIQNMIKRIAEQEGLIVKNIEEFANGGKIGLSKNERLVHGNEIIKAATKGDYSTDDAQVTKGYRLPHGYETTKRKRYDLGGNLGGEIPKMVKELYDSLLNSGYKKFDNNMWLGFSGAEKVYGQQPLYKEIEEDIFIFDNSGFTHYSSYQNQGSIIYMRYENNEEQYAEGGNFGEENSEMVANQNKAIKHHTEELKKILDSGIQAPAWVVAKVGRAANDLSDVTHYLDGEKMAEGGGVSYETKYNLKGWRKSQKSWVVINKNPMSYEEAHEMFENARKSGLYDTLQIESNMLKKPNYVTFSVNKRGGQFATGGEVGVGKKIIVETYKGEEEYTNKDIAEMISDIDKYWESDNLPKWLYISGKIGGNPMFPKSKQKVVEILEQIKNEKSDVYINVNSKEPYFKHTIKYATGGGVGYEILDDLKYKSFAKGSTIKGGSVVEYKVGDFVRFKLNDPDVMLGDISELGYKNGDIVSAKIVYLEKEGNGLNCDVKTSKGTIWNIDSSEFIEEKANGGNMTNDEKLFCDSIKNRFVEKENPTKAELKKAIEENMDSFSDEGRNIAKSVLSKI